LIPQNVWREEIKAWSILRSILQKLRCLGNFLAKLVCLLFLGDKISSEEYHQMSLYIIINTLLNKQYVFYNFCCFLTNVVLHKKKENWKIYRQHLQMEDKSFDDLVYMKEYISNETSSKLLRGNSTQHFDSYSSKFTPRGVRLFLGEEQPETSNEYRMEFSEFIVHLNLHLQMNLDFVFHSGIKEIVSFFSGVEAFMMMTFGNKDIEIKIDTLRLIIRMTNATSFVNKIFMLDLMRVEYLERWQTFSLFVQVLMDELRKAETNHK